MAARAGTLEGQGMQTDGRDGGEGAGWRQSQLLSLGITAPQGQPRASCIPTRSLLTCTRPEPLGLQG